MPSLQLADTRRLPRLVAVPAILIFLSVGCSAQRDTEGSAQTGEPQVQEPRSPAVREGDLRDLPKTEPWRPGEPVREVDDLRRTGYPEARVRLRGDTVEILDSAGRPLAAARPVHELWADTDEPCAGGPGAPAALLQDQEARRWILARLIPTPTDRESRLCIAVSRPPDPVTGGWHLYGFPIPLAPDAMKLHFTADELVVTVPSVSGMAQIHLLRPPLYAGDAVTPQLRESPEGVSP